jgi:hypothetical protein
MKPAPETFACDTVTLAVPELVSVVVALGMTHLYTSKQDGRTGN